MAEWLYKIPGITKQEGNMSFYDGFIIGAGVTFVVVAIFDYSMRSGQPSREDIFRSGYEQALHAVTRRMMDASVYEWSDARLKKAFESFVKPEYKSKVIECPYNLPWE